MCNSLERNLLDYIHVGVFFPKPNLFVLTELSWIFGCRLSVKVWKYYGQFYLLCISLDGIYHWHVTNVFDMTVLWQLMCRHFPVINSCHFNTWQLTHNWFAFLYIKYNLLSKLILYLFNMYLLVKFCEPVTPITDMPRFICSSTYIWFFFTCIY